MRIAELERRRNVLSISDIQRMKLPVASQSIDSSAAVGIRRPDYRCRGKPSGTKRIPRAPAARRSWILEVLPPNDFSCLDINGVNVVGDPRHNGDLFGPAAGV